MRPSALYAVAVADEMVTVALVDGCVLRRLTSAAPLLPLCLSLALLPSGPALLEPARVAEQGAPYGAPTAEHPRPSTSLGEAGATESGGAGCG